MKTILYGLIISLWALFVTADSNDDGYLSAEYCGSYLCSKYAKEAASYMNDRCLGNFENYVNFATEDISGVKITSGTSVKAILLLSLSIFSISFLIGLCSSVKQPKETVKSAELQSTFS